MKPLRPDRIRGQSGPLEESELAALLERGYHTSVRRYWAGLWKLELPGLPAPQELAAGLCEPSRVLARLGELARLERIALSQVAASGGRIRGDNLRRDLLLRGFGDTENVLRRLVQAGMLLPVPEPGEMDLEVEPLIGQAGLMQHDLAVVQPLWEALHEEALATGPEALKAWSGRVDVVPLSTVELLELNLMYLANVWQRDTIRLTRTGAPNRRDLGRFARGIVLPGQSRPLSDGPDLQDPVHFDYLCFLLALSVELGLAEIQGHRLQGSRTGQSRYFLIPVERRNRRLIAAVQGVKLWSEVDSMESAKARSRAGRSEQPFSFEMGGQGLIGARGYVLSVLRRASLLDWTSLDALVDLCVQLERSFLSRTLSRETWRIEPEGYIEALFKRLLAWSGLAQFGRSEDGLELVRFQGRTAQILGLEHGSPPESSTPQDSPPPCLIVQPNLEVMVFLDAAPLDVIFRIATLAERTGLADRVATFRLGAETAQRGFGFGEGAEAMVELLQKWSITPVPETVVWQLRDWERVQQRLTIFAQGALLRHEDPERLEIVVSQLEHELRELESTVVRLTPSAAYVCAPQWTGWARFVEKNRAQDVFYEGTLPACVRFVGPLLLEINPMACDLVTRSELGRIARSLAGATASAERMELDAAMLQARWPQDTYAQAAAFLEPRVVGGTPAEQRLRLRSAICQAPQVALLSGVDILVVQDAATAQMLMELPEILELGVRRLAPEVLCVPATSRKSLSVLMEALGVVVRPEA